MKFTKEQIATVVNKLKIKQEQLKEFLMGLKVELEHGSRDKETNVTDDDPIKTGKVVLAHLKELPNYYTKLKKMETEKGFKFYILEKSFGHKDLSKLQKKQITNKKGKRQTVYVKNVAVKENGDVKWSVSHSGKRFIGFHVPHPKRGIMTYDKQKGTELQKKRMTSLIQKNLKLKPTDKIEFSPNSKFISQYGADVEFKVNKAKKTYKQFYDELLDQHRTEHPNSSAPRDHVISMLYDDYVKDHANGGKTYNLYQGGQGSKSSKYYIDEVRSKKKLEKAVGKKDTSKLMKKKIINKKGKSQSVWVKKYGHLNLHRYPPEDVDPKTVTANTSGDIHSHSVLRWVHPKTGYPVHAYTKERMKSQAEKKWGREKTFPSEHLAKVDSLTKKIFISKKHPSLIQEASAVLNIISKTGLRVGEKSHTKATGNRGVLTLHPDNVQIKGSKITFDFTGKSYQQNLATIDDTVLANYLKRLKSKREGADFLFSTSKRQVDKVWQQDLGMKKKGFLIKDMRTKTASVIAKQLLSEKKLKLSGQSSSKQKKLVKEAITDVMKQVSEKLNNTPKQAQNSYVNPGYLNKWFDSIGLDEELRTGFIKKAIEIGLCKDFEYIILN